MYWNRGAVLILLAAMTVPLDGAEQSQADTIVVNKAKRELLLMRGGAILRSYRVALGSNPVGQKTKQGDGRTPEGKYFIDGRNARSRFYRSLHISYPNAADRIRAHKLGLDPGGEIMIHGLPGWASLFGRAHRLLDWTQGCIAVTNSEIEQIWRLVPNGAQVRINP